MPWTPTDIEIEREPAKKPAKSKRMATVAKNSSRGGSKPGERRGGRQKGTPNKRSQSVMDALVAEGLCDSTHPIVAMYRVYTNESHDLPIRVTCMKEVAQYLEPKRKAIELSGSGGGPVVVQMLKLDELEPSGTGVEKP